MTTEEVLERVDSIPSTVYRNEIELWHKHLTDLPKDSFILDVGTGWGKSAAALGLLCPESRIATIDWGDEYINAGRTATQYITQVLEYIEKAGANNVTFSMERYQEYTPPEDIDVLNIDVTASYDDYKGAVLEMIDYVENGGLVFAHSYIHPKNSGPQQVMNELVQNNVLQIIEVADKQTVGGGPLAPAAFQKL